jgi:hypothetical protein
LAHDAARIQIRTEAPHSPRPGRQPGADFPYPAAVFLRRLILFLTLASASACGQSSAPSFDPTHAPFSAVLGRFVTNGSVNYAGLKREPADLNAYLNRLATITTAEFANWPKAERLALLLNLYNAQTLRLILEHHPIRSIRNIGVLPGAAWKRPIVRWGGKTLSLDQLEHEQIRPVFNEPRIHFVLVCAAKGCPPLRGEPYLAAKLEAQLDDQARVFLGTTVKNRFDPKAGVLWLSPIFDWYGRDFGADSAGIIRYVTPYLPADARAELARASKVEVRFTDYDWSLNELPAAP